MKSRILTLGDVTVYLRLSAVKLSEYAQVIGSSGNILFAVLDALDSLDNQAALFHAALGFKGNNNTVHDGYELIDLLADAGYGPVGIKNLVVDLAKDSGVMTEVDAAKVVAAIKTGSEKLYEAAVAILSGDMSGLPAASQNEESAAEDDSENPT